MPQTGISWFVRGEAKTRSAAATGPQSSFSEALELLFTESCSRWAARWPFEWSGITTDFNGASVNSPMAEVLARAGEPS